MKKNRSSFSNETEDKSKAQMIDVTEKANTKREAVAMGVVKLKKETIMRIIEGKIEKGDVLSVARIAGISAAKNTWQLIPLCHPLSITYAGISFSVNRDSDSIEITATVKTEGKTGVEMEALTAVAASALTIYDMCKAIDSEIVISEIKLIKKTGGKSDLSIGRV